MTEMNNSAEIMASLKTKLKAIPLAQRGIALATYNKLKKYFDKEPDMEEALKKNNSHLESESLRITTEMDHIIDGERKLTEEELACSKDYLSEKYNEVVREEDNDSKRMKDYWLTVFKNGQMCMKAADEPIIKCLKTVDIRMEDASKEKKTPKTITLKLFFEKNNEFFENEELSVIVEYEETAIVEVPKNSTGTKINWKPGKIVTTKPKSVKKSKKDRKKAKQGKIEAPSTELSFFDIFGNFKAEDLDKQDEDPKNPQPNLMYVEEAVSAMFSIAGEDSILYYLDCIHEEEDEDFKEGEEDDDIEDDVPKKNVRKISTKSGKSGNKKSRKNTEDEIKIGEPKAPNKEECKKD